MANIQKMRIIQTIHHHNNDYKTCCQILRVNKFSPRYKIRYHDLGERYIILVEIYIIHTFLNNLQFFCLPACWTGRDTKWTKLPVLLRRINRQAWHPLENLTQTFAIIKYICIFDIFIKLAGGCVLLMLGTHKKQKSLRPCWSYGVSIKTHYIKNVRANIDETAIKVLIHL